MDVDNFVKFYTLLPETVMKQQHITTTMENLLPAKLLMVMTHKILSMIIVITIIITLITIMIMK